MLKNRSAFYGSKFPGRVLGANVAGFKGVSVADLLYAVKQPCAVHILLLLLDVLSLYSPSQFFRLERLFFAFLTSNTSKSACTTVTFAQM